MFFNFFNYAISQLVGNENTHICNTYPHNGIVNNVKAICLRAAAGELGDLLIVAKNEAQRTKDPLEEIKSIRLDIIFSVGNLSTERKYLDGCPAQALCVVCKAKVQHEKVYLQIILLVDLVLVVGQEHGKEDYASGVEENYRDVVPNKTLVDANVKGDEVGVGLRGILAAVHVDPALGHVTTLERKINAS